MTPQRQIDSEIGKLSFWGSECGECGNATYATMTCSRCGSNSETVPMWVEKGSTS